MAWDSLPWKKELPSRSGWHVMRSVDRNITVLMHVSPMDGALTASSAHGTELWDPHDLEPGATEWAGPFELTPL